ncbi:MAG: anthranilate synthase component II [Candidatus Comchoanobacterales bacterium]
MIWVINHHDSFVANVARYFMLLGENVVVYSVDNFVEKTRNADLPKAVILSPGPDSPADYPQTLEWIKKYYTQVPMLGICLGHQILAYAFGGQVELAKEPRHGLSTPINHHDSGLLSGLPNGFLMAHYHSLVVTHPGIFVIDAHSQEGEIMAIHHPDYPLYGVQYHPESILTEWGLDLCQNFLDRLNNDSLKAM